MVCADVVTIQPGPSAGKDALVSQGAPTTSYGSDVSLASGMGPDFGTMEKRSYVQFDLSSIPQGATINSATLSLYVSSTGGGAQTAGAYKITASWTEGSLNWNNQPAVNGTAESSATVSSAGWKSWTLTSLVSAWCGGSAANYGVCIKQSSGTPPNNVRFNSSNYTTDASLRPKLVVDYTGGGGGAPTAVTLNNPTNLQQNQMTLTWSQNNDANFQSYKLYRSTTAGVTEASTLVTTQNQQATTTFTDTGLTASTAYYYRVYVVNTQAATADSNEVNATTTAPPPTAVTLNNPTNVQSNQMTLTWSQNNDANFQSYKLYRSNTAGVTQASTLVTTQNQQPTTTFTDTGLAPMQIWYYKVYVFSQAGASTGSNEVNANTPMPPPTAVTLNNPTNIQPNQMTLTWSQNTDGNFQSYKLYRSNTAGVTQASTLVTTQNQQSATTFTDTGLNANTTYYYKLYVTNTGGVSAGSNEVSATTQAPPPQVSSISLTANPTNLPADGVTESVLTATVYNTNTQPMANVLVSFTTTVGDLSEAQVTTGSDGKATTRLNSTTAGTATVTATTGGVNATCDVIFTALPPPPPTATLTLAANPTSIVADGQSTTSLTATLLDANNQPMTNQQVTFQTTAGTLSSTTATTNDQGIASISLTSTTQPATATVTATGAGLTGSATVQFTALPAGVAVTFSYPAQSAGGMTLQRAIAGTRASSRVGVLDVSLPDPTVGGVAGNMIPVVVHVTVTSASGDMWGATGHAFWVDAEPDSVTFTPMPAPIKVETDTTHYALIYNWWAHGWQSGNHTLHVRVSTTHTGGGAGDPNHPQPPPPGQVDAQTTVNLKNDPIIVKGPEAVKTVCTPPDPPNPPNPGMMNCADVVQDPVTGAVKLRAFVRPAKGTYGDIYVAGVKVVTANPENWTTLDSSVFEVAGIRIGSMSSGDAKPDLDGDPSGHTLIFSVPWDSAQQTPCGDPIWPDGKQSAKVKAYCGPSVAEDAKDLQVHNKGGVRGVVKDRETDKPIEGVTLKATRTCQVDGQTITNVFGTATTDADGKYSMELYPGAYVLLCKRGGYVNCGVSAVVVPADTSEYNISMQPRLTLTVSPDHIEADGVSRTMVTPNLLTEEGMPEAGATVTLDTTDGTLLDDTLLTDNNGDGAVDQDGDGVIEYGDPRYAILKASNQGTFATVTAKADGCQRDKRVLFHKVEVKDSDPHHVLYNADATNPANAQMVNPTITFKVQDTPAVASKFRVTVSFFSMNSSDEPIATKNYDMNAGDQPHTCPWSDFFFKEGEDPQGRSPDPGVGIYAYQVEAAVAQVNEAALLEIQNKGCNHGNWRASKTLRVLSHSVELMDNESDTPDLEFQVNVEFSNDTVQGPASAKVVVYDADLAEVASQPLIITGKTATAMVTIPNDKSPGAHFLIDADEQDNAAEGKDAGKPALEVNQLTGDQLHIWVDDNYEQHFHLKAYWNSAPNTSFPSYYNVRGVFQQVAQLPTEYHGGYTGATESVRNVPQRGVPPGEVRAYRLNDQQQTQSKKRTVIVQLRSGIGNQNHPGASFPFAMTPGRPAISVINPDAVMTHVNESNGDDKMGLTMVAIHEITHIVNGIAYDGSNPGHHPKLPNIKCVYDSVCDDYFVSSTGIWTWVQIQGQSWASPWHSLAEINTMRHNLLGNVPNLRP